MASPRARLLRWLGLASLLMALGACGGDDSGSMASRLDTGPGKPIKNQKELVGSWYGPEAREIAGLEFTEEGTVMVTPASGDPLRLGRTVTWTYQGLEGGRVAMAEPNGMTRVFTATRSGDTLALTPEQRPAEVARLLRLDGETIAQAHQADAARIVERHQQMLQALHAYLQQPNLVLVSDDPSMRPARAAFEITGSPDVWGGHAYTEITAARRTTRFSLAQSAPGRPIVLNIELLDTVGPPGQHALTPQNEGFVVEGEPDALRIVGNGRKLVADAKTFDELKERYEAVHAEREAELAKFLDRFGAYGWLQGGYHYMSGKGPHQNKIAYALKRAEGVPAFEFVQITGNTDPNWNLDLKFNPYQQITVVYDMGKPVLRLPDQTLLAPVEENGKTVFRGHNRANQDALFEITATLTQEDLDARRALVTRYLEALNAGKTLRGQILTAGSGGYVAGRVLGVAGDGEGNVAATLKALEYGGTYRMTGSVAPTFLGATMQLQSTGIENEPYNQLMRGNIRVNLTFDFDAGPTPAITGELSGGYRSGHLTFTEVSGAELAAERAQLVSMLSGDGAVFVPVEPSHRRGQPSYRLKVDAATGRVTGNISAGPNNLLPSGPVSFTGQLSEQDGYVHIRLENPSERNDANRAMRPWEHFLWAIPTDEHGMILAGATALHSRFNGGKFDPRPMVLHAGTAAE